MIRPGRRLPLVALALTGLLCAGCGYAEWYVLERLETRDGRTQRFALSLLARCGGPQSALALARANLPRKLQDDVVATLGAIGGDESALALARLADVAGLEAEVVEALALTASPEAVPTLERIAARSPHRRSAVVAALGKIESPGSVSALIVLLPDQRAGRAALDTIATLPVGLVVPGLLDHCEETVPLHVRRALARIAGRDLGSSPRPWREWWAAHT